jgi:tetratricopeptide (TPR) repeat protein
MILAGVGLLILSGVYWSVRPDPVRDQEKLISQARASLTSSQPEHALAVAVQILDHSPNNAQALLIAGEAASRLKDIPRALSYYSQVPADNSPSGLAAAFGRAEMHFHLGHLAVSERELRGVLTHDVDHLLAHFRLAILLGVTGRRWEAIPHQMKLLRSGNSSVADLTLLSDPNRSLDQREYLRTCLDKSTDSALPQLGLAVIALAENETAKAESLLRDVLRVAPDLMEAQSRFGGLLALRQSDEFLSWHRALPVEANLHPGIWKARGAWAQANEDPQGAARCYFEGVRIAPDDRFLNYQLGLTLQAIERDEAASVYLDRYELLQQLAIVANGLHHSPDDMAGIRKAALLTERLGRIWETWAWAQAALQQNRNQPWAISTLSRVTPLVEQSPSYVVPDLTSSTLADVTRFSIPDWVATHDVLPQREQHTFSRTENTRSSRPTDLSLVDLADSTGIDFIYNNGALPNARAARIIETTGGGVAAWDYDGDLLPDLYLTQGGKWPVSLESSRDHDCVFRNLGDGTFADTSQPAGLMSRSFGQGVAIGDVNNDGFPDLYVACIGPNHLYLNGGDGTFSESSVPTMEQNTAWTTSCLIADLNGDGHADLYDVNYCQDEAGFETICGDNALPRVCSPLAFRSAEDRLLVNTGSDTFHDTSQASGIALPDGYGLGIVAGELTGDGQLDLFIANDQVSNFLFVNQTERPGKTPRFSEEGLQRGLAVNAVGQRQGSMGIASSDVNDDGLLDFFVTNFYFESNTLYVNSGLGLYSDRSRQADLRDSGFALLGFGTQFLDVDLDGRQDLVVANGHVDNLSSQGQPYQMPPQLYYRTGEQEFSVINDWSEGSFFSREYLGRGLARLDWNADGREEFVVSNIGAQCSLVANLTPTESHYAAVRLVGTTSSRDAIGATVRITTRHRQFVRHLTAGDGFQSSNERRLVFGLGDETVIEKLHIQWPSGTSETLSDVPVDTDVLLIEHHGATPLPRVGFELP